MLRERKVKHGTTSYSPKNISVLSALQVKGKLDAAQQALRSRVPVPWQSFVSVNDTFKVLCLCIPMNSRYL